MFIYNHNIQKRKKWRTMILAWIYINCTSRRPILGNWNFISQKSYGSYFIDIHWKLLELVEGITFILLAIDSSVYPSANLAECQAPICFTDRRFLQRSATILAPLFLQQSPGWSKLRNSANFCELVSWLSNTLAYLLRNVSIWSAVSIVSANLQPVTQTLTTLCL